LMPSMAGASHALVAASIYVRSAAIRVLSTCCAVPSASDVPSVVNLSLKIFHSGLCDRDSRVVCECRRGISVLNRVIHSEPAPLTVFTSGMTAVPTYTPQWDIQTNDDRVGQLNEVSDCQVESQFVSDEPIDTAKDDCMEHLPATMELTTGVDEKSRPRDGQAAADGDDFDGAGASHVEVRGTSECGSAVPKKTSAGASTLSDERAIPAAVDSPDTAKDLKTLPLSACPVDEEELPCVAASSDVARSGEEEEDMIFPDIV